MNLHPEKLRDQSDILHETDGRVKATEAVMNQHVPAIQAEFQQFTRRFFSLMDPRAQEIYFLQSNAELQKRARETPGYPVCRIDHVSMKLIIRPPLPNNARLSMAEALQSDPDSSEHLIALNIQDEFHLFVKRYVHALHVGGEFLAGNELVRGNAELARRAGTNIDSSYAQAPTWYPRLSIVRGPDRMPMLVDADSGSVVMHAMPAIPVMPRGPMPRNIPRPDTSAVPSRAAEKKTPEDSPDVAHATEASKEFVRSLDNAGPDSTGTSMRLAERLLSFLARLVGWKDLSFKIDGNTYTASRRPDGRLRMESKDKPNKAAQIVLIETYLRTDATVTDRDFAAARSKLSDPRLAESGMYGMSDAVTQENIRRADLEKKCPDALRRGETLKNRFDERGEKLKEMRQEVDEYFWKAEGREMSGETASKMSVIVSKLRGRVFVSPTEKALISDCIIAHEALRSVVDDAKDMNSVLWKEGTLLEHEIRGDKTKITMRVSNGPGNFIDIGSIIVDGQGRVTRDDRFTPFILEQLMGSSEYTQQLKDKLYPKTKALVDRHIGDGKDIVMRILKDKDSPIDGVLKVRGGKAIYAFGSNLIDEELQHRGIDERMPSWEDLPDVLSGKKSLTVAPPSSPDSGKKIEAKPDSSAADAGRVKEQMREDFAKREAAREKEKTAILERMANINRQLAELAVESAALREQLKTPPANSQERQKLADAINKNTKKIEELNAALKAEELKKDAVPASAEKPRPPDSAEPELSDPFYLQIKDDLEHFLLTLDNTAKWKITVDQQHNSVMVRMGEGGPWIQVQMEGDADTKKVIRVIGKGAETLPGYKNRKIKKPIDIAKIVQNELIEAMPASLSPEERGHAYRLKELFAEVSSGPHAFIQMELKSRGMGFGIRLSAVSGKEGQFNDWVTQKLTRFAIDFNMLPVENGRPVYTFGDMRASTLREKANVQNFIFAIARLNGKNITS